MGSRAGFEGGRCWAGSEYDIHFDGGVESLKTAPENLGTGMTVALASQIPADDSNHAHGLTECGRLFRWDFVFRCVAAEGLPLFVCEEDDARQVGRLPAEHGQMINTPSDNHIDAEASRQTIGGAQLTILYPAAAFERAMIDLDAPSFGIPLHTLMSVLEGGDLDGGQKHPFDGIDGVLGLKSRSAVRAAQIKFGMPADSWPTPELLQRLRAGR